MPDHLFIGLDGSNPLGFFAAIGAQQALANQGLPATLRFHLQGRWRPILHTPINEAALLDTLEAERHAWAAEPALQFTYPKGGEGALQRDLKPPPARARQLFDQLADGAHPRSQAMVAAWFTETATDNNGNTKPTALHFTAGQQQFLDMARTLQEQVNRADFQAALFAPWQATRELPVLGWDASVARDYALRAGDPSKDKKTGIPGADWLAFLALPNLPTQPLADRVGTPGIRGGWKDGSFTWPLWTLPVTLPTLRSLLTHPDLPNLSAPARAARGIGAIYESAITRSDQGGYGSFRPARPK